MRRPSRPPSKRVRARRPSRETLVLAAASGAITLALEALASRAFALVHENSVYSFATVVAVLLAGLACGAVLARSALQRGIASRALASAGWAGAGVWMVLLPALFVRVTGLDYLTGGGLLTHETHLALLAGAALLVPGVLLGLVLPALMQEEGDAEREGGPAVGAILAANTAGAILGPLVALFALAPSLGLWTAVSLLGACSSLCAVIAARGAARTIRRTVVSALVVAIVAFFVTAPASLPRLKLSGRDRLLHLSEGAFGSVAVVAQNGHRRIKLNNFYVLGGTHAAGDERLQGTFRCCCIRSRNASHFSASERAFPSARSDFIRSARRWRSSSCPKSPTPRASGSRLQPRRACDPRVTLRAEDARSYVAATRDRFDVVVGDLVVPGGAESRRSTRERVSRPCGACWRRAGCTVNGFPLYQISEAEFDGIAASFLDVFPQTTLWRGDFRPEKPRSR